MSFLSVNSSKGKSVVGKSVIVITLISVIVLAYNFPDSMINIIIPQAGNSQDSDGLQSNKMIEITGESFISDAQIHIDDATRTTAIVDAIRLYAHYQLRNNTAVTVSTDTSKIDWQWGGIKVSAKSISSQGLLTNEETTVSCENPDNLNNLQTWTVYNRRTIQTDVKTSEILSALSKQLLMNGVKLHGGKRLGRSTWQEKIYFPEPME